MYFIMIYDLFPIISDSNSKIPIDLQLVIVVAKVAKEKKLSKFILPSNQ